MRSVRPVRPVRLGQAAEPDVAAGLLLEDGPESLPVVLEVLDVPDVELESLPVVLPAELDDSEADEDVPRLSVR